MQAKITNFLLLCAMISTGIAFGMEEFTKKTRIITQERLLSALPQPHPSWGKPFPIEPEEGESDESFKIRRQEWDEAAEWHNLTIPITKEGAFLKIVTPSWTPSLTELEIEQNTLCVTFERSKKDHNTIKIKRHHRIKVIGECHTIVGERIVSNVLAKLLIPSKVD